MPKALHSAKRIYPAHSDAIRIVPLHLPEALRQPTREAVAVGPAAAQLNAKGYPVEQFCHPVEPHEPGGKVRAMPLKHLQEGFLMGVDDLFHGPTS